MCQNVIAQVTCDLVYKRLYKIKFNKLSKINTFKTECYYRQNVIKDKYIYGIWV